MTPQDLANFVEQNNLTHMGASCIFCSIVSKTTPSFKIGENQSNIAILELNPLSKGHSLIIPTEHESRTTPSTKNLAEEIKQKIWINFEPKEVQINEIEIMGHKLLDITPIYGNEKERIKATEEELLKLQEKLLKPIEKVEENISDANESVEKRKENQVSTKKEFFKIKPRIP